MAGSGSPPATEHLLDQWLAGMNAPSERPGAPAENVGSPDLSSSLYLNSTPAPPSKSAPKLHFTSEAVMGAGELIAASGCL